MSDLDRQLRDSADAARRSPWPGLRQRTLAALREQRTEPRAPTIRGRVLLAAAAFIALAATAALVIQATQQPAPPIQNDTAPRFVLELPRLGADLSRASAVRASLTKPLVTEARLLARDAERTLVHFRNQWPKLPTLEHKDPASQSIDRARLD